MPPRSLLCDSLVLAAWTGSGAFGARVQSAKNFVEKDAIETELLGYKHVSKASETAMEAFADDPMFTYLRETPDAKMPGRVFKGSEKLVWSILIGRQIGRSLTYTIDGGDAITIINPAAAEIGRPSPLRRILELLLDSGLSAFAGFNSKEQQKRIKESRDKITAMNEETLGEDGMKEMIYLDLLATAPRCQGRGYGSTLVGLTTSLADEQNRAAYLVSSNVANTGFYNAFGFVTVATVELGKENPDWDRKPVIVSLMVRERQGAGRRLSGNASTMV